MIQRQYVNQPNQNLGQNRVVSVSKTFEDLNSEALVEKQLKHRFLQPTQTNQLEVQVNTPQNATKDRVLSQKPSSTQAIFQSFASLSNNDTKISIAKQIKNKRAHTSTSTKPNKLSMVENQSTLELKPTFKKTPPKRPKLSKEDESLVLDCDEGVKIREVQIGDGKPASSGSKIKVEYKMFQPPFEVSSMHSTVDLVLAAESNIRGWNIGIPGMLTNGIRFISCPPNTAFGETGLKPLIEKNTPLLFEVTLLDVV